MTSRLASALGGKAVSTEGYKLIYEGVQPLWSRWAYLMMGMNVLWAGNMGTMALDRWYRRVPIEPDDDGGPPVPVDDWELRPLWQRAGAAAFCVGLGAASCLVVMLARSRSVSRVLVRQADARVMLETAGVRPGRGRVFPMADCTVQQGRAEDELVMHVQGIKLAFWPFLIRLQRGVVPGSQSASEGSSVWEKRRAFMQAWDNRQYSVRRVGSNTT